MSSIQDFKSFIKEKFQQYTDTAKPKKWLENNYYRVKQLFENYTIRDYIFEPFKSVFETKSKTLDADIYAVITQVAVINMVLAGIPGKMGVGVWVSVALEGWMAFSIARHVGIEVRSTTDIWKYFGVLAGSLGMILYGFRAILGFGFSVFSVIPAINPLIIAELLVTDLVGILFWVGFNEANKSGSFSIPRRMLFQIVALTKELALHQIRLIKNVFNIQNIKIVGNRLSSYLKGEFPVDQKIINGETFSTAAMAYLISGHYDKLQGPLGTVFIDAIRFRWSAQFNQNTSIKEIADKFRDYDPDQLDGVLNTIKGKMFEIMVTGQENIDQDDWVARMHTDETFPGSDIIFTNSESGIQLEVSLKAVSVENKSIIEHALSRYPDIPIMTTDEVAELYAGDDRVFGSGFSHTELDEITSERFDELISNIEPINAQQVVFGGVTVGVAAALWPFVIAYLRNRITKEQLEVVFERVLGESGVKLVSRITYATIFGPLFAWYLLAIGVKGAVVLAEPKQTYRMEFMLKA